MDAVTFQSALYGAVLGLGQGLFAIALVLTFRSTGFVNLSLGAVATVSSYLVWDLWYDGSVPLGAAVVIALSVAGMLGLASERVLRPLRDATVVVRVVASLGILMVLQFSVVEIWGSDERFLPLYIRGGVHVGLVPLPWQQIIVAGVTVVFALGLVVWGRRSASGIATLAVAEDPTSARVLGIRLGRVSALVWALSAVLAGAAGIGLSGFGILNSSEMTLVMVNAVAAAFLAGFQSIPMAVAAAAGVGALTGGVSSVSAVAQIAGLKESLGFIAVLAVIVFVRPRMRSLERA